MQIPFEKHFRKGSRAYDSAVGDWWIEKSNDRAHRKAYRNIASWIATSLSSRPQIIIDYACGKGFALYELSTYFPGAKLIGVDGSKKMLEHARSKLPGAKWICSPLPNSKLRLPKADCVLFTFPNFNYSKPITKKISTRVRNMAYLLSILQNSDDANVLIHKRSMSLNICSLLKRKGHWFKAEYSGFRRENIPQIEQWRLLLTEAALDMEVDGKTYRDPFRFLKSQFFGSKVVTDVYDQTLNGADRNGGYFISAFQAR